MSIRKWALEKLINLERHVASQFVKAMRYNVRRDIQVSHTEAVDSIEEKLTYLFLIHPFSDLAEPSPNLVALDDPSVALIERFKRLDKFSFCIEFEEMFPHHR
jgi:hypothetical protein